MASINDLAAAAVAQSQAAIGGATDTAGAGTVVRGALICLEGLDRSGKTTQVKLLEQRFVELGRPVKVLRFPGWSHPVLSHDKTPISPLTRDSLNMRLIWHFMACMKEFMAN